MSEVKRYDITGDMDGNCNLNEASMQVSEDGIYVKHKDYAALLQKLDAVVAENAALKTFIKAECSICNDDGFDLDAEQAMPLNPATDAILNAVRAEGAEAVASYHKERFEFLANTRRDVAGEHKAAYLSALDVAAQLRSDATKGGRNDK